MEIEPDEEAFVSKKPEGTAWEEWALNCEKVALSLVSSVAAEENHVRDLQTELTAARAVNDANDAELGVWSTKCHRYAEALVAAMTGGPISTEVVAAVEEAYGMVEQARAAGERRERVAHTRSEAKAA